MIPYYGDIPLPQKERFACTNLCTGSAVERGDTCITNFCAFKSHQFIITLPLANARAVITAVSCKLGKDEIRLKENTDAAVADADIVVLVSAEKDSKCPSHKQDVHLEEVNHLLPTLYIMYHTYHMYIS